MKKTIFILFILFIVGCTPSINIDETLDSQVLVQDKTDLTAPLDPTKVYVIDGLIDMGTTSIIVPQDGLSMISSSGGAFGISGFISSEDNYTLFSYINYSGNLFLDGGLEITLSGSNSTIYDLYNAGNFGAVEANAINYNDCTRIGELDSYRQVLSTNLGVFGCDDGLTFSGNWAGGVRISTAIVRGFGVNGTLFKAGENLTFNSRFVTDLNANFGENASLSDFNSTNFNLDSAFQITGAILTRDGSFIQNDTSYIPNIDRGDVKSQWKENVGIQNTFVGGQYIWNEDINTPLTFNISTKALGGTTFSDLQHFFELDNNSIQYLSTPQKDFVVNGQVVISNGAGDQIEVSVVKYTNSTGVYEVVRTIERKIINAAGNYDVANYDIYTAVTLNEFDFIEIWIKNKTDGSDAIVVTDSFVVLSER